MIPSWPTPAEFVEAYGYTLDQSANTLVVMGKSDPPVYVACVVLASTRLDVNKGGTQEAWREEVLLRRAGRHRRTHRNEDRWRHADRIE